MKRYWMFLAVAAAMVIFGGIALGLIGLNRPVVTQMTFTGGQKIRPEWAPDGSSATFLQIFTVDAQDGDILARLFRTDPDNRPPRDLIMGHLMTGDPYAWSEEGDQILIRTLTGRGDYIASALASGEGLYGAVYPKEGEQSEGVWAPTWDSSAGAAYFMRILSPRKGALMALDNPGVQFDPRVLAEFEVPDFEQLNVRQYAIRLSPEPNRIAYKVQNRIWVIPASGGIPTLVADDAALETEPAWAPDSSAIAYVNRDNRLVLADVDGSGSRELAPKLAANGKPDWSESGIAIAGRRGDSPMRIYVVNPKNGRTKDMGSQDGSMWPSWSPDGKAILYIGPSENGMDLWILARR